MGERRKLRHEPGAWVAHLRACHQAKADRRDRDGMALDSGIIPFGAVRSCAEIAGRRLAEASSQPLAARVLGADEAGVVLAVSCPYCGQEHRHIVLAEAWEPEKRHRAGCGQGEYRISL